MPRVAIVAPVLGSLEVTFRGVKESGEIFLPVMVTRLAGEKLNIPVVAEFCGAAVIMVCCGPDESTRKKRLVIDNYKERRMRSIR